MAKEQEQQLGPGARKIELERRLDANTAIVERVATKDSQKLRSSVRADKPQRKADR